MYNRCKKVVVVVDNRGWHKRQYKVGHTVNVAKRDIYHLAVKQMFIKAMISLKYHNLFLFYFFLTIKTFETHENKHQDL